MTTRTVKFAIAASMHRRLEHVSKLLHLSCEEVSISALKSGSPPGWDDVPTELQADLAAMNGLADDALWPIARSKKEPASLLRYDDLLARNQNNLLTEAEKQELRQLRTDADRFMLRKAHAAALLHWRGYRKISPLAEAADLLLADYQTDADLTSLTALDSDPFYSDPKIN